MQKERIKDIDKYTNKHTKKEPNKKLSEYMINFTFFDDKLYKKRIVLLT
jgi:hypothetical protein